MDWFKKLNLGQKLSVLIVAMVLFICLVGYIGFYFTSTAATSLDSMYKDKLVAVQDLNQMRSNFNGAKSDVYQLMLTENNEQNTALNNDIKIRRADNANLFENYQKTELDQYEVDRISTLKELIAAYRTEQDKAIALAVQNRNKEAYSYYSQHTDTLDKAQTILRELAKYNQDSARVMNTQNTKDSSFAIMSIILCVIASIVVAISFGVWFVKMFERRFGNLVTLANRVAGGDFTLTSKIEATDEIGVTGTALNNIAVNMRKLMTDIHKTVQDISSSSEEMSSASEQTAQGAQQVSTSVQQLAAGSQEQANHVTNSLENVNSISKAIQKISNNANNTVELSKSTENNAKNGENQAKQAVGKINQIKVTATGVSNTINELGKLSSDIEQIVDLIKNIASQTNLLALNAAIEAARAGEHGKGFAVVAEEVKKLAGESSSATDKITNMIKEIQNKTNMAVISMNEAVEEVKDGVNIVENTGASLEEILKAAKITSSQIDEISREVNNLATNSDNVVKMMENISSITEESAASSEEIASIVEEQTASLEEISANTHSLAEIAEHLQQQISVFKV